MVKKKVMLELPEDLHKNVKILCATQSSTIHDYIVNLIKSDIEKTKKND